MHRADDGDISEREVIVAILAHLAQTLLPATATRDRYRALIRFCTRTTSCTTIVCVRPSSRSVWCAPTSLNTRFLIAPVRSWSARLNASL
jgi:hypothetical protein